MYHKSKKTQLNQKQLLTEFVIKNFNDLYDVNTTGKDFKKPSIEETRDIRNERNNKWNKVIEKLNAIGPPKNLMQWKKCYSDIARHIRTKNNSLNSYRLANPNCEIPAHLQLNENEIKVLALHGNPLKTHKNRFDYEEAAMYGDPFNETQDSMTEEFIETAVDGDDDEVNIKKNDVVKSKRNYVTAFQTDETTNNMELDFEGFPCTSDEKEIEETQMNKNMKNKKISWKHKAKESVELQENCLKNLIDIRKELKMKKSCESCCESNKLIITLQKDNLNIQKMILDEQRKSNILQTKNLEIQLKILKELKENNKNSDLDLVI